MLTKESTLKYLFVCIICTVIYGRLFLGRLSVLSYSETVRIYLAVVITSGVCFCIKWKKRGCAWETKDVCKNFVWLFGTIFLLQHFFYYRRALRIVAGLEVLAICGFFICLVRRKHGLRRVGRTLRILRDSIVRLTFGTLVLLVAPVMVLYGIAGILPSGWFASAPRNVSEEGGNLSFPSEEEWQQMAFGERTEVMEQLAEQLSEELGLKDIHLTVEVANMRDATVGRFDYSKRMVTVAYDHVSEDSAESVCDTIAHEIFHVYEHEAVSFYENEVPEEYQDLALFEAARCYRTEFNTYIDGNVDYEGYAEQKCEQDSQMYAYEVTQRIYGEKEEDNSHE